MGGRGRREKTGRKGGRGKRRREEGGRERVRRREGGRVDQVVHPETHIWGGRCRIEGQTSTCSYPNIYLFTL